jgi:predicted RND superfamily exporter protein
MNLRPLFLPAALLMLAGCSKQSSDNTKLEIRLTDNPYNATEVNIDLQQVRVNMRGDSTSWINLDTKTGVYNLLGLQNGVDTLVATASVPEGTVQEIRLVLGSNNSIKIGSQVYPLTIPSGSESGLKIKVSKRLNAEYSSLLVDFDAGLSIVQAGNGAYLLKPVLRLK